MPEIVITDCGTEWTASSIQRYFKGLGVDHRRTTPYYPQGNSKTERLNRTLKELITKLVNNNARLWQDKLVHALLTHCNSVSVSTGYTPFYLLYVRHSQFPLTSLVHRESGVTDGLTGRLSDMYDALVCAHQHLADYRHYDWERINARAKGEDLSPGDTVVVCAAEPMKFISRFDPPFEVIRSWGPIFWIKQQISGKI